MKKTIKFLFLFAICLFVCGCDKTYNGFQFSEIVCNVRDSSFLGYYYYSGAIKNVSNKDCKGKDKLTVFLDLKSGSLTDSAVIHVEIPKKGEIIRFTDNAYDDCRNYKISISHVQCY